MDSPLTSLTSAHGATLESDCDGWRMPAHFGDPAREHRAAVSKLVIRDASHLGRFLVRGSDHLDFLHRMSTNDFLQLESGIGQEAVLTDSRGRILELGTYYHSDERTLAVVSPRGRERVPAWLDRYLFSEDVQLQELGESIAMIELFGPGTNAVLAEFLSMDLTAVDNHALLGPARDALWLARLDQLGHPGFRMVGPSDKLEEIWTGFTDFGAKPIGERAVEILRIEEGLPGPDWELTEDHNPWEAGLGRAIHMNKGCYIGQEVIARLDTYDKVKQHLVGLILSDTDSPAPGTALKAENRDAGKIASVCQSYAMKATIALAYVRNAYCTPGTELEFLAGDDTQIAMVAALPFASA